ncbi:MAG: type II toxin-antitoxin system RelE/ParE family toxin [Victivallales bacterium]|nr:type II toxin-antitoxin system RelE/ParE family toxin [Victivallales bacterium]
MKYAIGLKPRAKKDLRRIQKQDATQIVDALELLKDDLSGDVKRLTNFTPEYRLRVGQYRVLFEIEDDRDIVVYRIAHRRDAYRHI